MPKKINLVVRLQHWMDSVPGQTFLNYAYSWGASIVILGALFKLTHLPGGNLMLFLGMGTEVVVFFLSAFDRPFDKSEVGKELPPDYETDEEIAARLGLSDDEEEGDEAESVPADGEAAPADSEAAPAVAAAQGPVAPAAGGATVIIAGGGASAPSAPAAAGAAVPQGVSPTVAAAGNAAAAAGVDVDAQQLAAIIRAANDELLHRAQAVLSPEMEAATQTYIEKMQALAETLSKVDEQSARLARDSEEMENLNRTLTGINKVYELHLKGISLQVGTIDQINEQTQRLARQIAELNTVYGRMIQALTVNMRGSAATETTTGGNAQ